RLCAKPPRTIEKIFPFGDSGKSLPIGRESRFFMMREIVRLLPNSIRLSLYHRLSVAFPGHFRVEYADETFSQCGEDRILAFLFGQLAITTPRYLDVGTHHPCVGNNTYL